MDFIEKSQNGSLIKTFNSVADAEKDESMTRSQFIFYVAVRGVLSSVVMVFVSIINTSTIAVIYKHRVLQITSNALIVCFSGGHSLAVFSAICLLLSDFVLHIYTLAWKINCVLFVFLTVFQHGNNLLCIMAISIERACSIYFPFHSYKFNSFGRMMKVALAVSSISSTTMIIEITIGFITGNFKNTSMCTVYTVAGRHGFLFGFILYSIASVVCMLMSLLIVGRLIYRKRKWHFGDSTGPSNSEYKITKMLITGKV